MAAGLKLVIEVDDSGTLKLKNADKTFLRLRNNVVRGSVVMASGFRKMSSGIAKFGGMFSRAMMVAKLGLAALAVASVRVGAKFEQAMANVASVANATAEELTHLSDVARAWGETTIFAANEAAEGMYALASAGQTVLEIESSIGGVLMFAAAAATDLGSAAETTVQTLKMFGLQAEQTGRVVNVFSAGIANSLLNAERLRESLAAVGSTASAVGLSLEATVGVLGSLHNAGMLGSVAGTKLKNVLTRLITNAAPVKAILGDLVFTGENLAEVFQELQDKGTGPAEIFKAFGRIAGPAALALQVLGRDGIEQMTKKVTGTQTALRMYNQQMDTLTSDTKIFKSAMQENMIATFQELQPLFRSVMQGMTKALAKAKPIVVGLAAAFREWVANNKPLIAQVGKITAQVIAAAVAFKALATAFTVIKTTALIASGAVTVLQGALLMLTSPVFWVIAAVAALGITMWMFHDDSKSVLENVGNYFEKFFKFIGNSMVWVERALQAGFIIAFDSIIVAGLDMMSKLGFLLDMMMPGLQGFVSDLRASISADLTVFKTEVGAKLMEPFAPLKERAASTFGSVKGYISGVIASVKSLGAAAANIDLEGLTIAQATEGGGLTDDQKARFTTALAEAESMIQAHEAKMLHQAANRAAFEAEWLIATTELAAIERDSRLAKAGENAAAIAEVEIAFNQTVMDANIEHEEAVLEHYMETHAIRMAAMDILSAGFDAFYDSLFEKEMTWRDRFLSVQDSMKRSFVKNTKDMIKAWLKERIKGIILASAAEQAANKRSRFAEAKLGAIKAYQAFAGVPIVGPLLGAAAAVAAFAFLMAFHKGGLVPGTANDQIINVQGGEAITQRSSVNSETRGTLDYINTFGRVPETPGGGATFNNNFFISGGGDNESLKEKIRDQVVPILEELAGEGVLNLGTA